MPKIPKSAWVRKPKERNQKIARAIKRDQGQVNRGGRPRKKRGGRQSQQKVSSTIVSLPSFCTVEESPGRPSVEFLHDGESKLPLVDESEMSAPVVKEVAEEETALPDHSEECPVGPGVETLQLGTVIKAEPEISSPKSVKLEADFADSPEIKISHIYSISTSESESSPLKLQRFEPATSKLTTTVERTKPLVGNIEGCPADRSVDSQPLRNVWTCKTERHSLDSQEWKESVDALERSTRSFNPEENGDAISEAHVGRRLGEEGESQRTATFPMSLPSPRDSETSGISVALMEALSDQLKRCLPNGWQFRFHNERLKVEFPVPNPLRSGVQRAVNVACDGSDLKVQVHMETLPESHAIYCYELMKSRVPLSTETVKEFSNLVRRAVFAVQYHNLCIGVDIPEYVQNWHQHPNCTLDLNKFEQPEYSQTLRTKACSYLISARSKRCTTCWKYLRALKRREERRDSEGVVHPSTRHDILTPDLLKQKLNDKNKTIRSQEAKLTRIKERMNQLLGKVAVPVNKELSSV